jgi:nucleoside 2-deoxyribosyltransferase
MKKYQIYCAGPLFNDLEKQEMQSISQALEDNAYITFLPHRDGLEYSNIFPYLKAETNCSDEEINSIVSKAIFSLDIYKVYESDGLLLNMNGRVPDEGAMVEAGVAWAFQKKIVIYKNDYRSIINGHDNPMIIGLSGFELVKEYEAIPRKFDELFADQKNTDQSKKELPDIDIFIQKGKDLSKLTSSRTDSISLCEKILELFR